MLTPNYLTSNKSEEHPQAGRIPIAPPPSPCLKKPFPESLRGVQAFQAIASWTPSLEL